MHLKLSWFCLLSTLWKKEIEITHTHTGQGCVFFLGVGGFAASLLPPPGRMEQLLMAAVVSHYEPIWLSSWSHQRAVSTQTTAALPLSAAVKTARDLLQLQDDSGPDTYSLMWMQITVGMQGDGLSAALAWIGLQGRILRGFWQASCRLPLFCTAAETSRHLDGAQRAPGRMR